jgi:Family of unknown function (DUF6056)
MRLRDAEQKLPYVAALLLFVPIVYLVWIGSMNRYAADDWCWPVYVGQRNFLDLQAHMYQMYFGRWASTGLLSLVAYLPQDSARILPGACLVLLLASMTWFWREVLREFLPALILSQTLLITLVMAVPNLASDAFFWQTGLLTYTPPLVVGFAGTAAVLRWRSPWIAGLIAFLMVGFNETAMALTIAALALAVFAVPRDCRRLALTALFGALISAAIVVASPGNHVRQEREALDLAPVWLVPLRALIWEVYLLLRGMFLGLVFVVLIGRTLPRQITFAWRSPPFLVVGTMLILSLAAVLPSVYGINFVETRVLPTVLLPIAVGLFLVPLALDWLPTSRAKNYQLGVLCCLLVAFALVRFAPMASAMKNYGPKLAEQDKLLLAAPLGANIVIDAAHSPYNRLTEISRDPDFSLNQCVASYYGLASVRTR